jgi:colanic acid/amylovoran biosynthesis protein
MRVVILNTCSTLNRGDAAIVLGQIRLLQKSFPGVQVTITSKTPGVDQVFFAPVGVEVLPPFTPALSTYKGAMRKLMGSARAMADWPNRRRLVEALRESDIVLSCGGGYFYNYRGILPGTTFWQNVIHAYLATFLNRPLVFLPQSFGPFSSSLSMWGVRWLLEKQDVRKIFVREEVSYELLHNLLKEEQHARIVRCPDMACYLEGDDSGKVAQSERLDAPQPVLAINLREWTFPEVGDPASRRLKRTAYLDALTAAAKFFIQRYNGTVLVVPQALGPDPHEDDRGICAEFYQRLRKQNTESRVVRLQGHEVASLTDLMQFFSGVTMLIGTRLHSCILALIAGVPIVSVGYQYKSQGTLDMLGLGRFNTDIGDLSADWLAASVEGIMTHRQEINEEICQSLVRARSRIDDEVGTVLQSLADNSAAKPKDKGVWL